MSTARSIRRALERKAGKQIRKQEAAGAPPSSSLESPLSLLSQIQLEANRRNAQSSTGPITIEGKSRSSQNALKTGLTGRTVLLPNDDAAQYELHVRTIFSEVNPVGDRENELAQSIADARWRLARIPSLEFGIYALGRMELAEQFAHLPAAEAAALVQVKTFLTYQRQLNNLSIQESRLRRQCEKDTAELNRIQQEHAQASAAAAKLAARAKQPPPQQEKLQQSNGFVFSTELPAQSEAGESLGMELLESLTRPANAA